MFHVINREPQVCLGNPPHILIGVTSPQTCVVLPDRLRAFREAGFRVSLLSAPGDLLARTGNDANVETYAIPMQRGIAPVADCITLVRMYFLIQRLRPDVVEFSTPKAGLLGSIAARLSGVGTRIYLLRGLRLETATGLKRLLLLGAEWMASQCAHLVVCNSPSLRRRALECGIAPGAKLRLLGAGSSNGVDTQRFSPGPSSMRSQLGIPEDAPVIGFVGRLTRDKGLPELLKAFNLFLRRQPAGYLLLVGWFDAAEDALDRGLRNCIESHPRVIQTGFVQDAAAYYHAMDVLVLPSWREGFPNAVLEASASGVPVVVTDCTGSCDAVVPGVTGFLIPRGAPIAICQAVLSILGNPERRLAMAAAGRAWTVQNYDSRDVLGRTMTFYRSLIRQNAKRSPELSGQVSQETTGLSAWQ